MMRFWSVVPVVFCFAFSLHAEGQVDGVYFLPAEQGKSHFISIEGRSFNSQYRGMIHGEVEGHCNGGEAEAGELSFFYFNGEEIARTEVTYGVIDGELWLGVFRRGNGIHKENFHCNLRGTKFFGIASKFLPEGQFLWDIKAQTWKHYPLPQLASEETKIESVRTLKAALAEDGSVTMRPIFPVNASGELQKLFADLWFAGGSSSEIPNGRIGIFADEDREFSPEEKTALFQSMPEGNSMRGSYRQVGDVIIAPWSIRLGPVGLKPVAKKFTKVEGVWVDSQRADKLLEVIEAPKATSGAIFRLGPPNAEELGKRFSQLQYPRAKTDEDADDLLTLSKDRGSETDTIHTQVLYENCGMGHADWPGYIHWFATADDQVVRYIYPSTHTPITNHPVNRVQVFKRR